MTTTHYIGDGCPGGHREPGKLVDHLNRELAAVDIAAVAKRLTVPQRYALREAGESHLAREELGYPPRTYLVCSPAACRIAPSNPRANTVTKLLREDLITRGERHRKSRYSLYGLTDLGRAVLDHLAQVKS